MKAPITWVLLANAGRASVVENRGLLKGFTPVKGLEWTAAPPIDYADRAGSVRIGDSYTKTDPKDLAEVQFARSIAAKLHKSRMRSAFNRLVICAAPRMLGTLRNALSDCVRDALMAEVAKDLTQVPVAELRNHLSDVILA